MLASGGSDHTIQLWNVKSATSEQAVEKSRSRISDEDSQHLIKTLRTKVTPVTFVKFSSRNLLYGAGYFHL